MTTTKAGEMAKSLARVRQHSTEEGEKPKLSHFSVICRYGRRNPEGASPAWGSAREALSYRSLKSKMPRADPPRADERFYRTGSMKKTSGSPTQI